MDLIEFFLDWEIVWKYRSRLFFGLLVTLQVTIVSFVISLVPSMVIAIGRRYGPGWVRVPLMALVWMVRSVPAVVSVVFIFFALPFVGIFLSRFFSVVLAVTVVQVIYYSEVFRGALASVDKGQFEAGYALGFRLHQVLRFVVVPQAAAVAAPTFISSSVQLVQNSTIATVVALNDLLAAALNVQTLTGSPAPVLAAALVYLMLLLPLVWLGRRFEKRVAKSRERVGPLRPASDVAEIDVTELNRGELGIDLDAAPHTMARRKRA